MAISYRPMRAKDVPECVDVVAQHPILATRYGQTIKNLRAVWLGLVGRESFRAVVFENSQLSRNQIIGIGISIFVCDEFLNLIKRPPFFWMGPELTRRISRGESPLLPDGKVREANAKGGLNVITWEGVVRPEFMSVESHTAVFSAFVEQHRGFLLKELTCQGTTPEILEAILRSGGLLLGEHGRYIESIDRSLDEIVNMPHHLGITRQLALSRTGTWIASLFAYQAPRCGFRPSEQRLLVAALRGRTDQELAKELGISLSAVKKSWLSIYQRAANHLPSLFDNHDGQEDGERGKEKKQHLIAYLRDHPEELRPAGL